MGISLAKITDFFGLADDDMYEEAAPAPKKQVSRPQQQSAPKKERVRAPRSTYQKQEFKRRLSQLLNLRQIVELKL